MRARAHLLGRSRWWRALAFVMVVFVGSVGLSGASAAAESETERVAGAGGISSIEISVLYDGQSFGSLDDGPSNGLVATNDVVAFSWTVTATDLAEGVLEQTLPEGWSWDRDSLVPVNSSTELLRATGAISPDGRTLTVVVDTLLPGNPARFELGALRAVPSSAVPSGSVYTAQLAAQNAGAGLTAQARPVTVVSEPRAELWKSYVATAATSRPHDFGDGAGPVDSRYIDYRLSIKDPEGAFAIGSSLAVLPQPLAMRDTFRVTGVSAATEFDAEVTGTSVDSGSASIDQDGRAFTVTLDGFGAVSSAWVEVRLWVRYADLPANGGAVTVTNTIAPEDTWTTAEGAPIVLDTTNTTVARTISRPAETSPGSATKGIYLFTDQDAAGAVTGDPAQLSSAFTALTSGTALDREVAPGSLVAARLRVRADTVNELSTGLSNLVAYDFWNPAEQQIVDGQRIFVGQNLATTGISSNRYVVKYTAGDDAADPESNTWFDSIEAAGGVRNVSGIRVAYTAGVWKQGADPLYAWFTVGVPFRLVGPVGTVVADTSVYRFDEKPEGRTASSEIVVGSYRLSTAIVSSAGSIMSGSPLDYSVTPVATAPPGAEYTATLQGFGMDVTLPAGLRSVEVGAVPDGWTVTVGGDAETGATLHYAYAGEWDTSRELPTFTYSVATDMLAPQTGALVTTAVVHATGNTQANDTRTAVNTVSVQQLAAVSEQKLVVGDSTVQPGDTARWEARWYNTTSSSAGAASFIDVLPYDGDARGSRFSGSLVVTAAELSGAGSAPMRLLYTTSDPSVILSDADAAQWLDADGIDLADVAGVTALRVEIDDFGTTGAGFIALRVAARVDGARNGDRFANTVDTWLQKGGHLGESNRAVVDVVAGSIDGTVWVQANDPQLLRDTRPVAGASVRLLAESGDLVAVAVTDGDGGYKFDGLRAGGYRTVVDVDSLGAAPDEHIVNVYDRDGDTDSDSGSIVLDVGDAVHDVDFGYRFDSVAIGLVKEGAIHDDPKLGDLVQWTFTISNTGASDLAAVDLTEHLDGVQDLSIQWGAYPAGELPAGATVTATASSSLSAEDLVARAVTNTATVDALGPGGLVVSADAEATVTWAVTDPEVIPGGDGSTGPGGTGAPTSPEPPHTGSTSGGLAATGSRFGVSALALAVSALGALMVGGILARPAGRRRRA
ncbi:hypothetical protein LLS1_31020 [Leifsonia sp. LS1]|uniref:DUF7507 domain-containing protein n=1 Tax=Leifsonia sp. LS1 TaxID=2828483 RepID=UPI001CFDED6B|nr:SdrD B-like domain-containing protein [Leifsonia sp. LS1]GIT81433.1 hypothetical protein LLS1_31020 [Leifsonia sp. LS1]